MRTAYRAECSGRRICVSSQALLYTMRRVVELLDGDVELTRLALPLLTTGLVETGDGLPVPILALGSRVLAQLGAAAARINDRSAAAFNKASVTLSDLPNNGHHRQRRLQVGIHSSCAAAPEVVQVADHDPCADQW